MQLYRDDDPDETIIAQAALLGAEFGNDQPAVPPRGDYARGWDGLVHFITNMPAEYPHRWYRKVDAAKQYLQAIERTHAAAQ